MFGGAKRKIQMAKRSARMSAYKNVKRRNKGLNGSKKRLKVMLEEFRVDRDKCEDKWKVEAEKLTE